MEDGIIHGLLNLGQYPGGPDDVTVPRALIRGRTPIES